MKPNTKTKQKDKLKELQQVLDQKNRELEIEAALERVRDRAMAMHKSDELTETVALVYEQLSKLGFDAWSCLLRTREQGRDGFTTWLSMKQMSELPEGYYLPRLDHPIHRKILKAWNKQEEYTVIEFGGKEKKQYDELLFAQTDWKKFPSAVKNAIRSNEHAVICFSSCRHIGLQANGSEALPPEQVVVLIRFAKVFEQTYTRFLDLNKAESQAREAQIEAALERIRARTMAMQKSEELAETASLLYRELRDLGLKNFLNCGFVEVDESNKIQYGWMTMPDGTISEGFKLPLKGDPVLNERYKAWKSQVPCYQQSVGGKRLNAHMDFVFPTMESKEVEEMTRQNFPDPTIFYCANFKQGYLHLITDEELSEEHESLLVRFTGIFQQTYTRFLDLKKAETQAREVKINLALERVRSAAMAMHHSDELSNTISVLFEQLAELGINPVNTYLVLYDLENDRFEFRMTGKGGDQLPVKMTFSFKELSAFRPAQKAWKSGKPVIETKYQGEKRKEWLKLIRPMNKILPKESRLYVRDFPNGIYTCSGRHAHGSLGLMNDRPANKEEKKILVRFAKEFELVYKRFLDLQKAEAQAREAQIETSLERVRAASMAMHNSEDLTKVAKILYKEFQLLGLTQSATCGFVIVDEENQVQHSYASPADKNFLEYFKLPLLGDTVFKNRYDAWKQKEPVFQQEVGGNKLKKHLAVAMPSESLKEKERISQMDMPDPTYFYLGNFSLGYLQILANDILSEDQIKLIPRFAKVFEQAYTRFLDLKKAEAQAREAQIEAALEKVRSRSMAMHSSSELNEVAATLYEQLESLDLAMIGAEIILCNVETNQLQFWSTNVKQTLLQERYDIPINSHPFFKKVWNEWKKSTPHFVIPLKGKKKKEFDQHIFQKTDFKKFPSDLKKYIRSRDMDVFTFATMKYGLLEAVDDNPLPDDQVLVLQRFAKVFEQTYTRFLDLQKAEAQAREAQIEAALERVRASSMAMHKTEELWEVSSVVFEEFKKLGITEFESCGVHILDEENEIQEIYNFHVDLKQRTRFQAPLKGDKILNERYKAWKRQDKILYQTIGGKALNDHLEYASAGGLELGPSSSWIEKFDFPDPVHFHFGNFSRGYLHIIAAEELSEEHKTILGRIASVFEQAYIRFLDLKKAEAQAREAQIEAALERVRSRTMGMQKSEELGELVNVFFEQLHPFGIARWGFQLRIAKEDETGFYAWLSTPAQRVLPERYDIPTLDHWALVKYWSIYKNQIVFDTIEVKGKDKLKLDLLIFEKSELKNLPDHVKKNILSHEFVLFSCASMKFGLLEAIDVEHIKEEDVDILKRFAKVFEQTYTRFLDLKKAEAQAREAQIEAALERIRSKALAMQSSSELLDVSIVLREQMGGLGQPDLESSIIHLYNNDETLEAWYTFQSTETSSAKIVTDKAIIPKDSCDYIRETIKKYHSKDEEYTIVSKGKKLEGWYKVMVNVAPDTIEYDDQGKMIIPEILYYHYSKFSGGALLMISNQQPSDESKELQKRAAKVFNLAYQRFNDLQQAEARAKETRKQASLDRVRGQIASMRTKEDLKRITPVIWEELISLQVPFIRCGVFIINKEDQNTQIYLSTPAGKSLAVIEMKFDETPLVRNAVNHWEKKQVYRDEWDQKQFEAWTQSLINKGKIRSPKKYQGSDHAPDHLVLQFIPFNQGMLYVGSKEKLSDEQIALVHTLADSFSVAYARYEDFIQLENAKNSLEKTLEELRSTQSQLIHSEKMASLGELTAGIAHEIQNPLNFVNNFSEVSDDLIDEMLEDLSEGNEKEVREIITDLRQNLQKINNHGNRASEIVKGMLQHSRGSEGKKEPTDINMLADEYMRLAFHGMRARDKSFNAEYKLELDETIPKINVIPQDIGRVLLNLINNAFYAVAEARRAKETAVAEASRGVPEPVEGVPEPVEGVPEPVEGSKGAKRTEDGRRMTDFKPEIIVSTKKLNGKIEIRIKDNGPGIPEEIKDKIFQPFFTTKPTGQGTGLGLSLSYDIITKGHGGELKVASREYEGTTFLVILPI